VKALTSRSFAEWPRTQHENAVKSQQQLTFWPLSPVDETMLRSFFSIEG
jgi:hypothetical protein